MPPRHWCHVAGRAVGWHALFIITLLQEASPLLGQGFGFVGLLPTDDHPVVGDGHFRRATLADKLPGEMIADRLEISVALKLTLILGQLAAVEFCERKLNVVGSVPAVGRRARERPDQKLQLACHQVIQRRRSRPEAHDVAGCPAARRSDSGPRSQVRVFHHKDRAIRKLLHLLDQLLDFGGERHVEKRGLDWLAR